MPGCHVEATRRYREVNREKINEAGVGYRYVRLDGAIVPNVARRIQGVGEGARGRMRTRLRTSSRPKKPRANNYDDDEDPSQFGTDPFVKRATYGESSFCNVAGTGATRTGEQQDTPDVPAP